MAQTKDFSILKWFVFPSLTLALAGVIAYFNVRVFGLEDGAPYIIVVGVLTGFSIAINRYIGSENVALARAAFIFEIILIIALAINAAYSFSVQREMSIARQSEQSRSDDLKTISSLKSRTAQRDATRMIASSSGEVKSAQQIFADNERPLFWIMIAELLAYIVSAFTLLGISHLWQPKRQAEQTQGKPIEMNYRGSRSYRYLPDGRKQVTESTYSPDEVGMIVDADYEFPHELDVSIKNASKKSRFVRTQKSDSGRLSPVSAISTEQKAELQALREHLKDISFYHPGLWFKADLMNGGVMIRMYRKRQGREEMVASTNQSGKLLTAVNRPDFRSRLIDELIRQNFPIEKDKVRT